jgi:hypothetical protein
LIFSFTASDYGDSFADIAQALGHTLEVLDSDQDIAPSSFKYRKTLAEQVEFYCQIMFVVI